MKPETIVNHYNNLRRLGITPQKININANLLGNNPETIQNHYDYLRKLGINPKKISSLPLLLLNNLETIQNHYDYLRRLGISQQKIATQAHLLGRDPETILDIFRYFIDVIKIEEVKVQNLPQLLTENPDAFAKKMRILKLDIIELKRKDFFNPNEYFHFFISSPATIAAKRQFCYINKIDFRTNLRILLFSWQDLMKKIKPKISKKEANKEGSKLVKPYKQRYDRWMREYKKWVKKFFDRRGRRLILRI